MLKIFWNGEAGHLGNEGAEPAHESHLGGVVAWEVRQPLWHVLVVAPMSSLGPGDAEYHLRCHVNRREQPVVIAFVALDDVHVDQVLQLNQLCEPLPGVVRQVQLLDLAGRVEAEKDGVEDVQVDQDERLVGVSIVGLLRHEDIIL